MVYDIRERRRTGLQAAVLQRRHALFTEMNKTKFDWKKPYRPVDPKYEVEILGEAHGRLWGIYRKRGEIHWIPTDWDIDGFRGVDLTLINIPEEPSVIEDNIDTLCRMLNVYEAEWNIQEKTAREMVEIAMNRGGISKADLRDTKEGRKLLKWLENKI